jgi:hypothetical protein
MNPRVMSRGDAVCGSERRHASITVSGFIAGSSSVTIFRDLTRGCRFMLSALLVLCQIAAAPAAPPVPPPDTGAVSYAPTMANVWAAPLDSPLPAEPVLGTPESATFLADSSRRPKAIEYSNFYYTRLKIHQLASYTTIPLFVAEAIIGEKLYKQTANLAPGQERHSSLRGAHGALATAIGGLFVVNTVTGAWNLWDSRKDPHGRTRRWIHSLGMMAADAGFVATGATAPGDDSGGSGRSTHRTLAYASFGVALASYAMMLIWKD